MSALGEVLRPSYRPEPGTVEEVLVNAADATLSAGTLLAGTIIAGRRFNEDRSRLPTLGVAVVLGTEAAAATVALGRSFHGLARFATEAFVAHTLFRNRDS